jgi:putative acetyltransferase
MLAIRPETPADHAAVDAIVAAAFARPDEARLVAALRPLARPQVSLVATEGERVVGHVFFSPVTADTPAPGLGLVMGLAPLAVAPDRQRAGIGSALTRAGLDACRGLGAAAVIVLGHPEYYARFGFRPAADFALRSEYGGGDSFMALELVRGALTGTRGMLRYRPEFGAV